MLYYVPKYLIKFHEKNNSKLNNLNIRYINIIFHTCLVYTVKKTKLKKRLVLVFDPILKCLVLR